MSTKIHAVLLLALALALGGCGEEKAAPGGDGHGGGSGGNGGTAGGGGQGGSGGSGGGTTDPEKAPKLQSAAARFAGKTGDDLYLEFSGTDPDGDVDSALVRFLDSTGAPVAVFDSDADGVNDSADLLLNLAGSLARKKEFSGTSLLRGYGVGSSIELTLVDGDGNQSNTLRTTIVAQSLRQRGEACDPTFLDSRCGPNLTCRGEPATCHEGIAPEILQFAYLRSPAGPRILIEGEEPDDDMKSVILEFFDANGSTVLLDLDNDGIPEASRATFDAEGTSKNGRFFVAYETEPGFDDRVQSVAATPIDAAGRRGTTATTALTTPASRNRGQTCDPHGFDVCREGLACDPGEPGAVNKCQNVSTVSQQVCSQAPLLDPSEGVSTITGTIESLAGMWEPPDDCTATWFPGMPEAIVRLRLTSTASVLRITTDRPGTDFDTILYLHRGCETNREATLACNDDKGRRGTSTLELKNVPAGDYVIVIDSWNRTGGHFDLAVSVQ